MELKNDVHQKIMQICSDGDYLVENAQYEDAIKTYNTALDLLPNPKSDWIASTWIYTALGDTCFMSKKFSTAKEYLFDALNCPGGIENPFILLRLGESLFELGEKNKAKEYLLRAYMIEGYSIFLGEDDKYYRVIKEEI